jgi:hypothetical protein
MSSPLLDFKKAYRALISTHFIPDKTIVLFTMNGQEYDTTIYDMCVRPNELCLQVEGNNEDTYELCTSIYPFNKDTPWRCFGNDVTNVRFQ